MAEYEDFDMTPSWETAVQIHLMCIEHGDNEAAKQGARDEILRVARAYDRVLTKKIPNGDVYHKSLSD